MERQKYRQLVCGETGFAYDEGSHCFYGMRNGFHMALIPMGTEGSGGLLLTVSVTNGGVPDKREMKQAAKESKSLTRPAVQGYRVSYTIPGAVFSTKKQIRRIGEAVSFLPDFLRRSGYRECCELSGRTDDIGCYYVNGTARILCREEFEKARQQTMERQQKAFEKGGGIIPGIVGAFLGSILGAAVIVIVGQLGYISIWSGVVMGVCTIYGYQLFSGSLRRAGIFLSACIMIAMVYVANRADWAIFIARELEAGLVESFQAVPYVVSRSDMTAQYIRQLLELYLFTAIGAVPATMGVMQRHSSLQLAYRLDRAEQTGDAQPAFSGDVWSAAGNAQPAAGYMQSEAGSQQPDMGQADTARTRSETE